MPRKRKSGTRKLEKRLFMDGYTKHPDTFSSAKNSDINIAFSAISFECWILLHYEYTGRAFEKSDDIIKYMKKKNYIDYQKKSQTIYAETKDKIETAKENAIKLQKQQISENSTGTPIYYFNPYTNINELIDAIYNLQKMI